MKPAHLVLHPVRLRIAQAFLGDRELTTGELRAALPDVPPATLYRQITALTDGGVLHVVDERRVRGAVERRYGLRARAAWVDGAGASQMTVEEHRQAFLTFVTTLLADFDRYLGGAADFDRDVAGYRQAALNLTDDEARDLADELRAAVAARSELPASPDRRRRLLTTVLLPGG